MGQLDVVPDARLNLIHQVIQLVSRARHLRSANSSCSEGAFSLRLQEVRRLEPAHAMSRAIAADGPFAMHGTLSVVLTFIKETVTIANELNCALPLALIHHAIM